MPIFFDPNMSSQIDRTTLKDMVGSINGQNLNQFEQEYNMLISQRRYVLDGTCCDMTFEELW